MFHYPLKLISIFQVTNCQRAYPRHDGGASGKRQWQSYQKYRLYFIIIPIPSITFYLFSRESCYKVFLTCVPSQGSPPVSKKFQYWCSLTWCSLTWCFVVSLGSHSAQYDHVYLDDNSDLFCCHNKFTLSKFPWSCFSFLSYFVVTYPACASLHLSVYLHEQPFHV